jgi:hypothetical protein
MAWMWRPRGLIKRGDVAQALKINKSKECFAAVNIFNCSKSLQDNFNGGRKY